MDTQHSTKWVEGIIRDFICNSPENSLKNEENEKAWAEPLVGFSSGADPIYEAFKEYVDPSHFSPLEIFSKTFPLVKVEADQLTIISWILPQTDKTKSDNRKETLYPSERWARARIFGEQCNVELHKHVVAALLISGHEALAPALSPHWERKESERYGRVSTWSQRHVAYASGLGTFGLCDGLITPKGKAMRCGSVIANIQIPPTIRPYKNHREYCLFFSTGECNECIQRCPGDAITEAGHDKVKCRDYMHPLHDDYVKSHFGFKGYGCGLCQTGVPCESKIPTKGELE
jgi:hypothetical protein